MGMDVIASFMTRDVFITAPSVLTCYQRYQREVVIDSPERVDVSSWQ